jgi:hypothetical protein
MRGCKLRLMRRAFALQCCLALVVAFILAPFQHVHRDEVSGSHHTHVPFIHTHLYGHHHDHADDHVDKPGEREIESADEEQASSLDTFTLVLTADFAPFVPSRAPGILPPPAETRESFELIEERGHDPPHSRHSSPRAPPV